MKTLRLLIFAAVCSALNLYSARADATWLSDFDRAQKEARASHKLLLLNFTGSDWCGWCIRLQAEVFSKPEFADYAKQKLVLMTVDFPRAQPLSNEVRQQNSALAQKYEISGFPTIVVLNGEGKQVGLLGYMPGGPGAFIGELKKLPEAGLPNEAPGQPASRL